MLFINKKCPDKHNHQHVTNDLVRRCHEHKNKLFKCFTKRFNVDKFIHYECFGDIGFAIKREKQIKGYSREKKELLIEKFNPDWIELYHNGHITKIPHSASLHSE